MNRTRYRWGAAKASWRRIPTPSTSQGSRLRSQVLAKTTSLLSPALFHFPEMGRLLTLLHESRNILQQMLIVRIRLSAKVCDTSWERRRQLKFYFKSSTEFAARSFHCLSLAWVLATTTCIYHLIQTSVFPHHIRQIFFRTAWRTSRTTQSTHVSILSTSIPSTIFYSESAMIIGTHRYIILVTYLLELLITSCNLQRTMYVRNSNSYLMFTNLTFAERTINMASVTVRYYS
jgi:hypothetical protein